MTSYRKVETAFSASVRAAAKSGRLDPETHAAAIAAARKLARVLDSPGWPELPSGKADNVTPATFLNYCKALGLVPGDQPQVRGQTSAVASLRRSAHMLKAV